MKQYKIAMAIIMMAVTVNTFGQSMTYNHDASKMGQIQVMELGAGVLTPDLYYSITHSGYKEGAKSATSVKNTLRMAANIGRPGEGWIGRNRDNAAGGICRQYQS